MKKILANILMIANLVGAGVLAAKAADRTSKSAPKIVYEKKTSIDLNEKDVDGQFLKPNGRSVRGDQNLSFDSLMKPRKDFNKELQRSSGAL